MQSLSMLALLVAVALFASGAAQWLLKALLTMVLATEWLGLTNRKALSNAALAGAAMGLFCAVASPLGTTLLEMALCSVAGAVAVAGSIVAVLALKESKQHPAVWQGAVQRSLEHVSQGRLTWNDK